MMTIFLFALAAVEDSRLGCASDARRNRHHSTNRYTLLRRAFRACFFLPRVALTSDVKLTHISFDSSGLISHERDRMVLSACVHYCQWNNRQPTAQGKAVEGNPCCER